MNGWYEQAADKLNAEIKKVSGRKENVMKNDVKNALLEFSKQDAEFAQAVVQGGSFPDCLKAVAKGMGDKDGCSDLAAYRKAVAFYFPGADIEMTMRIDLCASVKGTPAASAENAPRPARSGITLNLSDFL